MSLRAKIEQLLGRVEHASGAQMQVMTLRDEVEQLLDEHASEPLADYLTGCLNAYEPNSWQQAVAIRKEWRSYERQPKAGRGGRHPK